MLFICGNSRNFWRSPDRIPATYLCYKHVRNVAGCHADLYTVSRCRTRDESQEFMACRWQSTQARDPPWLWNPVETSSEVQNRGYQWPHKKDSCPPKILKNEKKKKTPEISKRRKRRFSGSVFVMVFYVDIKMQINWFFNTVCTKYMI